MRFSAPRIVTIHDVMPATLAEVEACIKACEEHKISPIYLLVVPGLDWQPDDITILRDFTRRGHRLVAHGWVHRIDKVNGFKYWLHSKLISRQVAEHLSLDSHEILSLMQRSRAWFEAVSLPIPNIYVPPAWALGGVSFRRLKQTGFRYVECQWGIYDTRLDAMKPLPLLGYEVDTKMRQYFVRTWNGINRFCENSKYPARLSIHPYDFSYKLHESLWTDLKHSRGVEVGQVF